MEQMDAVFWLSLVDTFRARKLDLDLKSRATASLGTRVRLCVIFTTQNNLWVAEEQYRMEYWFPSGLVYLFKQSTVEIVRSVMRFRV
jgi:hypothetical protein